MSQKIADMIRSETYHINDLKWGMDDIKSDLTELVELVNKLNNLQLIPYAGALLVTEVLTNKMTKLETLMTNCQSLNERLHTIEGAALAEKQKQFDPTEWSLSVIEMDLIDVGETVKAIMCFRERVQGAGLVCGLKEAFAMVDAYRKKMRA